MALALSAGAWIEHVEYPAPADFADCRCLGRRVLRRPVGARPRHGAKPVVNYAFLWALWLSAVPYGLWSEQIRRPSMEEHVQWVERLEVLLGQALDHFGLTVRTGMTVNDLACAIASLIEGVWLNQCLTTHHPCDPSEPIATVLRRGGRMLWLGATEPAGATRPGAEPVLRLSDYARRAQAAYLPAGSKSMPPADRRPARRVWARSSSRVSRQGRPLPAARRGKHDAPVLEHSLWSAMLLG